MSLLSIRYTKGLSLVELMVALVLSLVIGVAVMQVFLASKTTYRMQDAMSRLQENGRFAVNLLVTDIRMAGYIGCLKADEKPMNIIANDPPSGVSLGKIVAVEGQDNVQSHSWGVAADTDVIVLRKAAPNSMRLVGNMGVRNANIKISQNTANLKDGDIMIISDCVSSDMFRAGSVSKNTSPVTITHPQSENSTNFLSKAYEEDAEILAFQEFGYFVKETGRVSPGGQRVRALYQRDVGGSESVELVEGVHDMQIEYGVRTGANLISDEYRTAAAVTDWGKVMSVRFRLLMQSADNNAVDRSVKAAQSISFNGAVITADGHLRQEFGSVVTIRNRVR